MSSNMPRELVLDGIDHSASKRIDNSIQTYGSRPKERGKQQSSNANQEDKLVAAQSLLVATVRSLFVPALV